MRYYQKKNYYESWSEKKKVKIKSVGVPEDNHKKSLTNREKEVHE